MQKPCAFQARSIAAKRDSRARVVDILLGFMAILSNRAEYIDPMARQGWNTIRFYESRSRKQLQKEKQISSDERAMTRSWMDIAR